MSEVKKTIISTLNKVRKHGIVASSKIFVRIVIQRCCSLLKVTFYYNLIRLILTPNSKKKRILGIWDYKSLPWSVGDPLFFIEILNVLKIKHNAEEVDICLVYDREDPAGTRGKGVSHNINPENARDYMMEFLPLFSACSYLGSIFQFISRQEFYRFIKNNAERYHMYPPLEQHLNETYDFSIRNALLKPIQEFYILHGNIPHLRIGVRDMAWAQWFYMNHLPKGAVPVSLSLKQTLHRFEHNADQTVWLSFIDKCCLDFPDVVFVVVGLREEVFEGLRNRSNVVIAKDFGTSIMEDLALIRASLMYMGTCSGVNIIAMFSALPYLIFQMLVDDVYGHGMKMDEKFPFVTNQQKIFSVDIKVTLEFLFKEFKALYSRLDKNEWYSMTQEKARNKHGHPATRVRT